MQNIHSAENSRKQRIFLPYFDFQLGHLLPGLTGARVGPLPGLRRSFVSKNRPNTVFIFPLSVDWLHKMVPPAWCVHTNGLPYFSDTTCLPYISHRIVIHLRRRARSLRSRSTTRRGPGNPHRKSICSLSRPKCGMHPRFRMLQTCRAHVRHCYLCMIVVTGHRTRLCLLREI